MSAIKAALILLTSGLVTSCSFKSVESQLPLKSVQLFEARNGEEWQATRRVRFSYSTQNQLTEELTEVITAGSWTPVARTSRYYDQNGQLSRIVRETWQDDTWHFAMQSRFNNKGVKVVGRMDSIISGGYLYLSDVDYEYDGDALLAEVSRRVNYEDRINNTKIVYHYNDKGLAVEKEFPVWQDSVWQNARKMTLSYNQKGDHLTTTRFNWTNGAWVESIHYDMTVDKEGKRLVELWQRPDINGRTAFTRVRYEYLE